MSEQRWKIIVRRPKPGETWAASEVHGEALFCRWIAVVTDEQAYSWARRTAHRAATRKGAERAARRHIRSVERAEGEEYEVVA